jgi:hypothetical protein
MKRSLLIALRNQIKDLSVLDSGLCLEISKMKIDQQDRDQLHLFVYNNRPKKGKHFCETSKRTAYFWQVGLVQPRLDWLNNSIRFYWVPFKFKKKFDKIDISSSLYVKIFHRFNKNI